MDKWSVARRLKRLSDGEVLVTDSNLRENTAIDFEIKPENRRDFAPRGVHSSFVMDGGEFQQFEIRLPKSRSVKGDMLKKEVASWIEDLGIKPLVQGEDTNHPKKSNVFVPDGHSAHLSIQSEVLMEGSGVGEVDTETALDYVSELVDSYRDFEQEVL